MGTITRNFANNILGTGEVDATDGVNGTIPATNVADASLNNVTSLPSSVGYAIKSVASDPPSLNTGEIFYNSTAGAFKALVNVEAWSSGAPLSVSRNYVKGCGTQTAALSYAGYTGTAPTTSTEEYNGSGWSTGGNMGAGAYSIQAYGTQTAAVQSGSYPNNADTEEYDGSAWTAGGNLNTGRGEGAGFGILTAGVVAGGFNPGPTSLSTVEHYDGTSYSSATSMSNARRADFGAAGIQTAGLAVSGPPSGTAVEEYDGTTWTAGGAHPSSLSEHCATGTQTDALVYGVGPTPAPTQTTKYDGTTWTVSPATLATGRRLAAGAGADGSSALLSGGYIDGPNVRTNLTEEYNSSTNTIVAAAWASGGNVNTARAGSTGFGSQTAAIAANGDTYPPVVGRFTNAAEEYNGATWTSVSPTNTSTNFPGSSKLSPASAGSVFGGEPISTRHEYWDGSTWSEQTDMNTPRYASGGAGTQTSSLAMAGIADTDATEEWDGSSWTTAANIPFATFNTPGAGSQTAAIIFGGNGPSGLNTTAEYNSGTWTTGGNLIGPKTNQGGAGTQTAALSFMGAFPTTASAVTTTEGYDGTAWSTRPSAATARRSLGSAGTSTAALGFSGYIPGTGKSTATEEFTGETITQVAKTLSSS
jgi:hypothetical protein